jgi:hypothetical protein
MHKNATKCNKTQSKWRINKHEESKIIDTFETYHRVLTNFVGIYMTMVLSRYILYTKQFFNLIYQLIITRRSGT